MSQLISGIATNAPIWVWPLLVVLILVGIRSSRDRTTSAYLYYGLPLLGIMTLNAIANQPNAAIAWACFVTGYLIGIAVGYSRQSNWLIEKSGARLTLKGEWFTLTVMMVIFFSNFVNGFMLSVAPTAQASPIFTAAFALIIGLAAGSFLGRAAFIFRS